MKKTLIALSLVAATCGAFAQTTPVKAKKAEKTVQAAPAKPAEAAPAKEAASKKVTMAKKSHKVATEKKSH